MTTTTGATTCAVEAALDRARAVADAVLLEGYVLYPYRASAAKNQLRWQFGVLAPPSFAALGTGERAALRAECLLDPRPGDELVVRLRCLQLVERRVERRTGTGFRPVRSLRTADRVVVPWSEARPEQVELRVALDELAAGPRELTVELPGGTDREPVPDAPAGVEARLRRRWWPLRARVRLETTPLPGPYGTLRLRLDVANASQWADAEPTRDRALRHSLIAAHTLLGLTAGRFLSLADPPEWARGYAAGCVNEGVWPVLLGGTGAGPVVLASPIILDDDPQIAPESPGDLYDGLEIDEILTLRTMALTEEEKAQARGTDARAAAVVERADTLPPAVLERLHGAIRSLRAVASPVADDAPTVADPAVPWWDPGADCSVSPETDTVDIDGVAVGRGSHVTLCPDLQGADAQDFLVVGQPATVAAVLLDVDGAVHLAVTLDNDPAADLAERTGRYRYYRPSELRPAEAAR